MARPKTRPPTPEPKATQQRLRVLKKAHKGDTAVGFLCDQIIAQTDSVKNYNDAGDFKRAAYVKDKLQLSMKRLAERLAKRNTD